MAELSGRVAAVTGGSRGIGLAIARALSAAGADVIVLGRDEIALRRLAESLPRAWWAQVDITDQRSIESAFEDGAVDILVNNAGAAESKPFERMALEDWNRMIAVNATGACLCAQRVLPSMKAKGWGRIVNIASTASLKGYPYSAAYCAAKHALLGLTRALAAELAKTAITVNAVCPGFAETDLLEKSVERIVSTTGRRETEAREALRANNPQGRFIQPEEVAAAVVWLCSDAAASVTGQAIAIDGGETT